MNDSVAVLPSMVQTVPGLAWVQLGDDWLNLSHVTYLWRDATAPEESRWKAYTAGSPQSISMSNADAKIVIDAIKALTRPAVIVQSKEPNEKPFDGKAWLEGASKMPAKAGCRWEWYRDSVAKNSDCLPGKVFDLLPKYVSASLADTMNAAILAAEAAYAKGWRP